MKLSHAVSISILVHLVLVLGLIVMGYEFKFEKKEPQQWLELNEPPQIQMSDVTKRVEKETRAKDMATSDSEVRNQMTAPNLRPSQVFQGKSPKQKTANKSENETLGEKLRSINPDSNDIFMRDSANAASSGLRQQLQSFLPKDLEIGDITALNTDQNLFFTFYRRMAEKVVWPWAQNVVASFEKMKAMGKLGGSNKGWVTIIEVILDKNGTVIATQPLQLAGDWEMDSAPVKAFKQAKNFPNPPAEMLDEDGYIRIRYRFTVFYNPSR